MPQILHAEPAEKLTALRNCSYFNGLGEAILIKLAEEMRLVRFARGEILFWQGDPSAGLQIIREGSVKLFKLSPQGRELIINTYEDGATFNEVSVFDNGVNPVNVAALEDSDVWILSPELIQETLYQHPEMGRAVIQNLARNLRMMVGIVEELSFYQVTNRLARLLSQLPPDQLSGEASSRITQDQLAARLGTVREVVSRSLRELERSGAIRVYRRQIEVIDPAALELWAQGPYNEP